MWASYWQYNKYDCRKVWLQSKGWKCTQKAKVENVHKKQRLKMYKKTELLVFWTKLDTLFDIYVNINTVVNLHKKYQGDKKDSILNKYSKDNNSIDEIMDQIETGNNYHWNNLLPKEQN